MSMSINFRISILWLSGNTGFVLQVCILEHIKIPNRISFRATQFGFFISSFCLNIWYLF